MACILLGSNPCYARCHFFSKIFYYNIIWCDLNVLIQSKYNEFSKKEFYIKSEIAYKNASYIIHGFIDGVLNINDKIIIEEIKSTIRDFDEILPLPQTENTCHFDGDEDETSETELPENK